MTTDRDYITVHVLDTTTGRPAGGMAMVLTRVGDAGLVVERVTNADGRSDTPLLDGAAMTPGLYEITFDVEAWRGGHGDPGFYDRIAIRFIVATSPGHIHIPLLLSPYGYSTYRGS